MLIHLTRPSTLIARAGAVALVASALLVALPARSEEPVCKVDEQGDAWDTCVAYCDTLDCDQGAGPSALCAELLSSYHEERPGFEPPCVP